MAKDKRKLWIYIILVGVILLLFINLKPKGGGFVDVNLYDKDGKIISTEQTLLQTILTEVPGVENMDIIITLENRGLNPINVIVELDGQSNLIDAFSSGCTNGICDLGEIKFGQTKQLSTGLIDVDTLPNEVMELSVIAKIKSIIGNKEYYMEKSGILTINKKSTFIVFGGGGGGGSSSSGETTIEVDEPNESIIVEITEGCLDPTATNYNPEAEVSDDSCIYVEGCTNIIASNYNSEATLDDGSCTYVIGCTDPAASNYNPNAIESDGSCTYPVPEHLDIEILQNAVPHLQGVFVDGDRILIRWGGYIEYDLETERWVFVREVVYNQVGTNLIFGATHPDTHIFDGSYITLTYDGGQTLDVYLPEITPGSSKFRIWYFITNDGSLYEDSELTQLAKAAP